MGVFRFHCLIDVTAINQRRLIFLSCSFLNHNYRYNIISIKCKISVKMNLKQVSGSEKAGTCFVIPQYTTIKGPCRTSLYRNWNKFNFSTKVTMKRLIKDGQMLWPEFFKRNCQRTRYQNFNKLISGVSITLVIRGHWRCNRWLWLLKGPQDPFPLGGSGAMLREKIEI